MKGRLRIAEPSDVSELHAIRTAAADALTDLHGTGFWSTVTSERTMKGYTAKGTLYAYEYDGQLLGTLGLVDKPGFVRKGWFRDPDASAGYVIHMAVSPEHQEQGHGRRCMECVERLARDRGREALRLDSLRGPAGAGEFYRKCGYEQVHEGSFNDVPLVYWEKVLA